mmetsp:Transcript_25197/g.52692  ORF Transcript_25197/g.52692 Transcript_25197/m.52692 type:complete len:120 (+) Transcript_25197:267-626(+)
MRVAPTLLNHKGTIRVNESYAQRLTIERFVDCLPAVGLKAVREAGASGCTLTLQLCLPLQLLLPPLLCLASLLSGCSSSRCALALFLYSACLSCTPLLGRVDDSLCGFDPSLELHFLRT